MSPENVNYPPVTASHWGRIHSPNQDKEKGVQAQNKADLSGDLLKNEKPGSVPPSAKIEKTFNHYAPFITASQCHITTDIAAQKIPSYIDSID